ncbi:unnamed protein product [Miscanthus lutarioriparius]|uniref:Uncharacterized protein n=1 Tax=Miscanthus lutarioriparius TaxID=422564 RepID=A0A811NDX7_9POAL|nr:unnamed protein product [Miscanthus lutarioriparius]
MRILASTLFHGVTVWRRSSDSDSGMFTGSSCSRTTRLVSQRCEAVLRLLTIGTGAVDSRNPSTMNPHTEISPSTQSLLDEIHRRFDEADARWDRRFARLQQLARGRAPSSCNDDSGAAPVDALVTSADPDAPLDAVQKVAIALPHSSKSSCLGSVLESDLACPEQVAVDAATSACTTTKQIDAVVVADNWDGLFEQPALVNEEQHADGNQDSSERKPTSGAGYQHLHHLGGASPASVSLAKFSSHPAVDPHTPLPFGTTLEVSVDDDGLHGSWFEAATLDFESARSRRIPAPFSVEYACLLADVAGVLAELSSNLAADSASALATLCALPPTMHAARLRRRASSPRIHARPDHFVLGFAYTELATTPVRKLFQSTSASFYIDVAPNNTADYVPTKCSMYCCSVFTSMLTIALSKSSPIWVSAEVDNNFDKRLWPPPSQAQVFSEQGCVHMASDINVLILLLAGELIQEQKQKNHNGCSSNTNLIFTKPQDSVQFCISFTLTNSCSMNWVVSWKPPWPIQLRQQIRYRAVTSAYYRSALGALLLYDIPRRQSFHHIPCWLDAQTQDVKNIVIMLVRNKSDLEEQSPGTLTTTDILALKRAISESHQKLADQLAEAACQSSIVVLSFELQFLLSRDLMMDLVFQAVCSVHAIRDFRFMKTEPLALSEAICSSMLESGYIVHYCQANYKFS